MIGYVSFKNSDDFEVWQKENPQNEVCTVSPFVSGIDMELTDKRRGTIGGGANTVIDVFVTYSFA